MWLVRGRRRVLSLLVGLMLPAVVSFAADGGFAQADIPDGAFVQDAGGAVWLLVEGRRVRVPIYPMSDDEVAALPLDGRWLVPQDGIVALGDRPAWLDAEREGEFGAGGGIVGLDGVVVTVLHVSRRWLPPLRELRPRPGMEYLTIEVEVRNDGNQARRYSAFDFSVDVDDGSRWSWTLGRSPDLLLGTLPPQTATRGWLTFQVPIGRSAVQLVWLARRDYALAIPL